MVHSWRHIKHDFLHHFHCPRIDLLIWILITKLAPTYYTKLDWLLRPIGQFRELPSWRKDFKRAWKKATKTPITLPLNDQYRPDAKRWVCTCRSLAESRFLICKHLVQFVHPVPPTFFLEVKRQRSAPFWNHKSLIPLKDDIDEACDGSTEAVGPGSEAAEAQDNDPDLDDHDLDDGLVDMQIGLETRATFRKCLNECIWLLREFADGLKYQQQFTDHRMLETLEWDGAGLFRLTKNCLSHESHLNSSRSPSPTTWERTTSNAMYYRAHPRTGEEDTWFYIFVLLENSHFGLLLGSLCRHILLTSVSLLDSCTVYLL